LRSPAPRGSRWKVPPKPPKDSGLDSGVWAELAAAVNNRGCATSSDQVVNAGGVVDAPEKLEQMLRQ
jgi:hypothetical protein